MALSCSYPTVNSAALPQPPPPSSLSENRSHIRIPDDLRLAHKGFQARRDAMSLISASLLGSRDLLASDVVEARNVKPETRQKIREKLDKLREKGGVTKEKIDPNSGNKEQVVPKKPSNSLSIHLVEASM